MAAAAQSARRSGSAAAIDGNLGVHWVLRRKGKRGEREDGRGGGRRRRSGELDWRYAAATVVVETVRRRSARGGAGGARRDWRPWNAQMCGVCCVLEQKGNIMFNPLGFRNFKG